MGAPVSEVRDRGISDKPKGQPLEKLDAIKLVRRVFSPAKSRLRENQASHAVD